MWGSGRSEGTSPREDQEPRKEEGARSSHCGREPLKGLGLASLISSGHTTQCPWGDICTEDGVPAQTARANAAGVCTQVSDARPPGRLWFLHALVC